MLTGDVSINRDAPIICCTAEILANIAIRPWDDRAVDVVIMDEFHYYSDKERGVAWQIPLLTMPQTQFMLMSATMGKTQSLEASLTKHTTAPALSLPVTSVPSLSITVTAISRFTAR